MSEDAPHGAPVRQEEDVVAERRLTGIGLIVVAVALLSVGVAALVMGGDPAHLRGRPAARASTDGIVAPPTLGLIEQTLVEHEATGLRQRQLEEERLHHYGWVDRARGVAHIPIDEAMDLVVAETGRDAGEEGAP
jgi:hypothetical protein